jgi:methylenetetrahydrofolate reductase (NADPH)
MAEDVRPINWANRPKSYVARTNEWDDFPNGRWGDNRSPAFGDLSDSHFFRPSVGSIDDRKAMWGDAPLSPREVSEIFAKYVEGLIPVLPWCEVAPQDETTTISTRLARINRHGFMTINSQPAVNGVPSDDPVFGWGGRGGRVYQKAYIEFFCSPEDLKRLHAIVRDKPLMSLYAIDHSGVRFGSANQKATALTWGVFPDKEIQQPTIFDPTTFAVWSQEAFQLWLQSWACLYDDETDSAALIHEVSSMLIYCCIISK